MRHVLDILYVVLLVLASPWLLYRAVFRKRSRRGWSQKLFGRVPVRDSGRNCIWMHAVSVGEVNLLAPLIERLLQRDPDLEIVISTTTETGFDLANRKYAVHTVFFFPLDFSWAIRAAMRRVRPGMIVLAELELWPNLISIAHSQDIPVAVINGRLSESSFRGYKRLSWLLKPVFEKLTCVAAQNEQYADRFRLLGTPVERVTMTGNVKFDGVSTDRNNPDTLALSKLAGLAEGDFVLVAGSTQPEENLIATNVYQQLVKEFPSLRLVLVPRHPETCAAVAVAIERQGLSVELRSELSAVSEVNAAFDRNADSLRSVLLVDVIGELSAWWGCADVAYVGGSLGQRGGQNMIEPAAYGVPVSFGPNTWNFSETVDQLLAVDAATVVHDADQFASFVRQAITDRAWASSQGERAQRLVCQHAGAADRTVDRLLVTLRLDDGVHRQRAA